MHCSLHLSKHMLGGCSTCMKRGEPQGATVALPFGLMTPAGGSMYVSFPGGRMLLECSMSEVMSKVEPVRGQSREDRFRQGFKVKSAEGNPGAPSSPLCILRARHYLNGHVCCSACMLTALCTGIAHMAQFGWRHNYAQRAEFC